jgi:2-polyprenyl-6-methoxyphenol hydroxylase-like FAD-dependent oxidoreductase
MNITILESRLTRSISLAGGLLMLAPNGMRILGGLALANNLLNSEDSIEVPAIHVYESNGGLLGKIPGTRERFKYPSVMSSRMRIHEVLLEDVERRGIEVKYGAKVKSLEESDDGVVVRWMEKDEEKETKVDFVVGADGIWSVVRNR